MNENLYTYMHFNLEKKEIPKYIQNFNLPIHLIFQGFTFELSNNLLGLPIFYRYSFGPESTFIL